VFHRLMTVRNPDDRFGSTAAVLHLRESVSFISADRRSTGSIYGSFAALNGDLDRHTDRILGILEADRITLESREEHP
jgi:hypothetical protein